MSLAGVFAPLDELFRRSGIRYAVIGAYAVAAWGTIRATRDLDLLIETRDVDLLRAELRKARFDFEYRRGNPDDPIQSVLRLHLVSELGPQEIDILAGIKDSPSGITDRAAVVEVSTLGLRVAAPEDVIVLKLLAGSLQDIEDARTILITQGTRISRDLLGSLCPARLREPLQQLLNQFPNPSG